MGWDVSTFTAIHGQRSSSAMRRVQRISDSEKGLGADCDHQSVPGLPGAIRGLDTPQVDGVLAHVIRHQAKGKFS
jgi:hypothetical protein